MTTGVPLPTVAALRVPTAKCTVLEIGGQLFFERERHGLRDACATAHRQFRRRQRCFGGRQDNDGAPALRLRERVGDRAAVHGAGTRAVAVHDEPRRRRLLGRAETDHQGFCHTVTRLRNCAKPASRDRCPRARADCTG